MRQWTDETDREADEFFATLTLAELRRRQDICGAQIVTAHANGLADALEDLQAMDAALARAVLENHLVSGLSS